MRRPKLFRAELKCIAMQTAMQVFHPHYTYHLFLPPIPTKMYIPRQCNFVFFHAANKLLPTNQNIYGQLVYKGGETPSANQRKYTRKKTPHKFNKTSYSQIQLYTWKIYNEKKKSRCQSKSGDQPDSTTITTSQSAKQCNNNFDMKWSFTINDIVKIWV